MYSQGEDALKLVTHRAVEKDTLIQKDTSSLHNDQDTFDPFWQLRAIHTPLMTSVSGPVEKLKCSKIIYCRLNTVHTEGVNGYHDMWHLNVASFTYSKWTEIMAVMFLY